MGKNRFAIYRVVAAGMWRYIPTLEVSTVVVFVLFDSEAVITAILSMVTRSFVARPERDVFENQ